MYDPKKKTVKKENRAIANSSVQTGNMIKQGFQIADNRSWKRAISPRLVHNCDTSQRQILQLAKVINIDKVVANSNTEDIDANVKPIKYIGESISQSCNPPSPGYIGSAIVYSGEPGAEGFAKKYVEESQDWSTEERKARLGVKFVLNKKANINFDENAPVEKEVSDKTDKTFEQVKGKASSYVFGLTWGYSYSKGGLASKVTTEQISKIVKTGKKDDEDVKWIDKNEKDVKTEDVLHKLNSLRDGKGIPYGMLRSWVVHNGQNVNAQLEQNGATPIYIHSIDADAPTFTTLKKKESSPDFKKILDAYDSVLVENDNPEMVIGGYNLLAQSQEYTEENDYRCTVQSNVVDLAIRQAIHQVAPMMTYPTEPNFLIQAAVYNKTETAEANRGRYAWGDKAFEGRHLFDNVIKSGLDPRKVVYDPLASVPTGVKAGGARLKIEREKKYDEDTLKVKPHTSSSVSGDSIPLEEQYIVQAQSLAGASRLATAYVAAYNSIDRTKDVPKKDEITPCFYPVEDMVLALLRGTQISKSDLKSNYPLIPEILNSIKNRLTQLQENGDFYAIIQKTAD